MSATSFLKNIWSLVWEAPGILAPSESPTPHLLKYGQKDWHDDEGGMCKQ